MRATFRALARALVFLAVLTQSAIPPMTPPPARAGLIINSFAFAPSGIPSGFQAEPAPYAPLFQLTWTSAVGADYDEIRIGDDTWRGGAEMWIRAEPGVIRSVQEEGFTTLRVRSVIGGVPTAAVSTVVVFAPVVVLASSVTTLDCNPTTRTGTDNTAALQAVLDTDSDAAPVMLVIDGHALISNSLVGKRIRGISKEDSWIHLAAGVSKPMIRGPCRYLFDGSRDAGIILRDITLDGNGTNQDLQEAGTSHVAMLTMGTFFTHVNAPRFSNIHFVEVKCFNLLLGDYINGHYIKGITAENGATSIFQDRVHVWGPGTGTAVCTDVEGTGGDDTVGYNLDEALDTFTTEENEEYGSTAGAVLDPVIIRGIRLNGSNAGVRLLSLHARFENVTVEDVSGEVGLYAVHMGYTWAGKGYTSNFGTVRLRNISHTVRAEPPEFPGAPINSNQPGVPSWNVISIDAHIDALTISELTYDNTDGRPTVYMGPVTQIAQMTVPASIAVSTADHVFDTWAVTTASMTSLRIPDSFESSGDKIIQLPSAGYTDSYTVTGWVTSSYTDGAQVLASQFGGVAGSGNSWEIFLNTDNTFNAIMFGVTPISTPLASDGAEHFFAFRVNYPVNSFQIKADAGGWVSGAGSSLLSTVPVMIGGNQEGAGGVAAFKLHGAIRDLRIVKEALSDEAVEAIRTGE